MTCFLLDDKHLMIWYNDFVPNTNTCMQHWLSVDNRFWQASSSHVGRKTTTVSVDSETSFAETQSQNSRRRSWLNWIQAWNSPGDVTPSSIATSLNCRPTHIVQFKYCALLEFLQSKGQTERNKLSRRTTLYKNESGHAEDQSYTV